MKRLRRLGGMIVAFLRELSDENAYQRHLSAHGCEHSPEQWRKFSEERMRAKYSQAKCC